VEVGDSWDWPNSRPAAKIKRIADLKSRIIVVTPMSMYNQVNRRTLEDNSFCLFGATMISILA
jgi:hypothetical protein